MRTASRELRSPFGFYLRCIVRKPVADLELTPLQQAFVDGFRKGWNLACDHLNDRVTQIDAEKARYHAIEAALKAARDPGDPAQ
jgi:hypothetical protein